MPQEEITIRFNADGRDAQRALDALRRQGGGVGAYTGQQLGYGLSRGSRGGLAELQASLRSSLAAGAGAGVSQAKQQIFSLVAAVAGASALGGSIKLSMDAEQAQIAFTTLLGSSEAAMAHLKDLSDFAASTPFEFTQLQGASRQLINVGYTAEQVIPALSAVGDAVAAVGGNGETINGVITALGQMKSKGAVSAEEMAQIAERGIPVWQILAKTLGVDVQEAMELATKGALDSASTVNALLDGMASKYGGSMEAQSRTTAGVMSTLKDNAVNALTAVGDSLVGGLDIKPAIEALSAGVLRVAEWLRSGPLTAALSEVRKKIGEAFSALGLGNFVKNASSTLGTLRGEAQKLFQSFGGVGALNAAWETVKRALSGVGAELRGVFAAAKTNLSALIASFGGMAALKQIWDNLKPSVQIVVDIFKITYKLIKDVAAVVFDLARDAMPYLREAFKLAATVGVASLDAIKSVLKYVSDNFYTLLAVIKTIGPAIIAAFVTAKIVAFTAAIGPAITAIVGMTAAIGASGVATGALALAMTGLQAVMARLALINPFTAAIAGATAAAFAIKSYMDETERIYADAEASLEAQNVKLREQSREYEKIAAETRKAALEQKLAGDKQLSYISTLKAQLADLQSRKFRLLASDAIGTAEFTRVGTEIDALTKRINAMTAAWEKNGKAAKIALPPAGTIRDPFSGALFTTDTGQQVKTATGKSAPSPSSTTSTANPGSSTGTVLKDRDPVDVLGERADFLKAQLDAGQITSKSYFDQLKVVQAGVDKFVQNNKTNVKALRLAGSIADVFEAETRRLADIAEKKEADAERGKKKREDERKELEADKKAFLKSFTDLKADIAAGGNPEQLRERYTAVMANMADSAVKKDETIKKSAEQTGAALIALENKTVQEQLKAIRVRLLAGDEGAGADLNALSASLAKSGLKNRDVIKQDLVFTYQIQAKVSNKNALQDGIKSFAEGQAALYAEGEPGRLAAQAELAEAALDGFLERAAGAGELDSVGLKSLIAEGEELGQRYEKLGLDATQLKEALIGLGLTLDQQIDAEAAVQQAEEFRAAVDTIAASVESLDDLEPGQATEKLDKALEAAKKLVAESPDQEEAKKSLISSLEGQKADISVSVSLKAGQEEFDAVKAQLDDIGELAGEIDVFKLSNAQLGGAIKDLDALLKLLDAIPANSEAAKTAIAALRGTIQGQRDSASGRLDAAADADKFADRSVRNAEANAEKLRLAGGDPAKLLQDGYKWGLAYWKGRLAGLEAGSEEFIAITERINALQARANSASDAQAEENLRLAQSAATRAKTLGQNIDTGALERGIAGALVYWQGRLEGLAAGSAEYMQAFDRITALLAQQQQIANDKLAAQGVLPGKIAAGLETLAPSLKNAGQPVIAAVAGNAAEIQKAFQAGFGGWEAVAGAAVGGLAGLFEDKGDGVAEAATHFAEGIQGAMSGLAKGDWVGAIVSVVAGTINAITDLFAGAEKSRKQAQEEAKAEQKNFKLIPISAFSETKSVSRGLADAFGGPATKFVVDEFAKSIATTLEQGVTAGLKRGIKQYLQDGDSTALFNNINDGIREAILDAIVEAIINEGVIKGLLAGPLAALTRAIASGDPEAIRVATEALNQAVPQAAAYAKQTVDALNLSGSLPPSSKPAVSAPATGSAALPSGTQLSGVAAAQFGNSVLAFGGAVDGYGRSVGVFGDLVNKLGQPGTLTTSR